MKRGGKTALQALAFWASALAGPGHACAFHGYTPNPTLVDLVMATEHLVIARPLSGAADVLIVSETLMGPPVDRIHLPGRRGTQAASESRLLLRDGPYGPWMDAVLVDAQMRAVLGAVLQRLDGWQLGGEDDRLQYFAALVNATSPQVRRLALLELDRAPYGALKRVRRPEVKGLGKLLVTGREDLKPIRALLAGLSGDAGHRQVLQSELARALKSEQAQAGAYATALIELDGVQAVRQIFDTYLEPGHLSVPQQQALVSALALQYRNGPADTRRAIVARVARLSRHSDTFGDIARGQFTPTASGRLLAVIPARQEPRILELPDVAGGIAE
ncbi:MAG: hypothetical protein AAF891_04065 [Pseudomonadota bacterium]